MRARRVKGLDPDGPLAENVERIVRVRLEELASFMPRAADPAEVRALHDMRIAAKRLRYILELTSSCFGPYAATAARHARAMQELVGEIHDCDVMLPRIEEHARRVAARDAAAVRAEASGADDVDPALAAGAPERGAYAGLGLLAVHVRARRELLFERFLAKWSHLEQRKWRERLEQALGERQGGARNGGAPRGRMGAEPPAGRGGVLQ